MDKDRQGDWINKRQYKVAYRLYLIIDFLSRVANRINAATDHGTCWGQ
ncbi:MAG: hypothetical protein SH818_05500 [Saprospiraceae bacterium]|nr:hypothetical protein [Saprospiraceae bacterium]